jgi:hypothetical protein
MAGTTLERTERARVISRSSLSAAKDAVGFWNGFAWQGGWAWRWKDRIDRRFVARYA